MPLTPEQFLKKYQKMHVASADVRDLEYKIREILADARKKKPELLAVKYTGLEVDTDMVPVDDMTKDLQEMGRLPDNMRLSKKRRSGKMTLVDVVVDLTKEGLLLPGLTVVKPLKTKKKKEDIEKLMHRK